MSSEAPTLTATRLAEDIALAKQTYDVIQSDSFTLLLDLDTPEAKAQYARVFPKFVEHYEPLSSNTWLSKSGNTHVSITLRDPLPLRERIALQAALGSDGVKEVLSLVRARNGCSEPCLLFKPKPVEDIDFGL